MSVVENATFYIKRKRTYLTFLTCLYYLQMALQDVGRTLHSTLLLKEQS